MLARLHHGLYTEPLATTIGGSARCPRSLEGTP